MMYAILENLSESTLCLKSTDGKSLNIRRLNSTSIQEKELKSYANSINSLVQSKLLKLSMSATPVQSKKDSTVKTVSEQTKVAEKSNDSNVRQLQKRIKELKTKFKATDDHNEKLKYKNQINEIKEKIKELK